MTVIIVIITINYYRCKYCYYKVAGSSPLAAGCRVATVGQLFFAAWASAYSTLYPLWVGKYVPAIAGKV